MAKIKPLTREDVPEISKKNWDDHGYRHKFTLSKDEEDMLKSYIIPVDYERAKDLPYGEFHPFDRTHGAGHMFYVLRRCKMIIDELNDDKIDEHLVYTMAGLHDVWRAWDINQLIYDAAIVWPDPFGGAFGAANPKKLKTLGVANETFLETLENTEGENRKKLENAFKYIEKAHKARGRERLRHEANAVRLVLQVQNTEPKTREKEFELIKENILFRRKIRKVSHGHEKAAANPRWGVPMLLRMYGLDLAFTQDEMERMLVFLAMHDRKNIVPKGREEKIVKDADLWDSRTPYSVQKTVRYNLKYGTKTFFDPKAKMEKRLKWLKGPTDDMLTVLLGQFYKWSSYLTLNVTKQRFEKSLPLIEKEIVRYANEMQEAGPAVREVLEEYKEKVIPINEKDKKKGPVAYGRIRREVIKDYRDFLNRIGGYEELIDTTPEDWFKVILKL